MYGYFLCPSNIQRIRSRNQDVSCSPISPEDCLMTCTVVSSILLNGPNLNLLGTREPQLYGTTTLKDVEQTASKLGAKLGAQIETFQSNHGGHLIDRIHAARGVTDAIVINPGAFTHTSVAIWDALVGVCIPLIEVHITNVHTREAFRQHSYLSDKAAACAIGLGVFGYEIAVEHAVKNLVIK